MSKQQNEDLLQPLTAKDIAAYGIYGGGNGICAYMLNSFGTYFYTNVAGINSLVAGSFMTVCKVIDFITDLIMGGLIDSVHNKSGEKARPWLLRSILPSSIGLILLFTAPFAGGAARLIWAIATYFLATSICFTMSIIPYQALLPLMSNDRYSRSKMEVTYSLIAMIISLVAGVSVEPMVNALGGGKTAWVEAACILSVICLAFHIIGYLGTKERVHIEKPKQQKASGKQLVHELGYLLKNRYWVTMLVFTAAASLSTMASSMVYYAQYVAGDMGILAYMMVLNMAPTMVMLVIAPFIIKRFGKVTVMRIGVIMQAIGFITMWINPGSGMYVGLCLSSFGQGGSTATMLSFIADAIDYGEYKFGVRTEGIGYSVNLSVQKLAQACASLLLGALLAWGGYDATAMVQTDSAVLAIKIAFIGVPIVICVITGICSILMNVEKKYPDMPEKLAEMRAARQ